MRDFQRYPWFKFFPSDFVFTCVKHNLTPEAAGIHIRLFCLAWADPDRTIPSDETEIRQLLGGPVYNPDSLRLALLLWTHKPSSGSFQSRLYCPALEQSLQAAVIAHRRHSAAGKKGASIRWPKTPSRAKSGLITN